MTALLARPSLRALVVAVTLLAGITTVATEASAASPSCSRRAHVGRIVDSAFGRLRCTRVAPGRYRWRPVATAPAAPAAPIVLPGPTVDPAATLILTTEPWAAEMLASVNQVRAAAGVAALVPCGRLMSEAQAHAADQASTGVMSHVGSDGSSLVDRATRSGYLAGASGWRLGENVAFGYADVAPVMAAWMASPEHRANLLDPAWSHVGFGRAAGATGVFWAQEFGVGGTC